MNDLGGGAFVGRDAELRVLLSAANALRQGRGGLVLVTGEAGVGKTRLVTEATGHAADGGVTVAWGYGRQSGTVPLGPWRDLFRRLGVSVDDVAAASLGDPERLFANVCSEIERLASAQPLLLALEDLHWFDDQSLRLLEWVRPALCASGALVVATARADVPHLGRPDHHVRLGGLTAAEVAALVASHTTADVDPVELCRRTGGNPLFVLETAQDAHGGIPASVAEVVRQRIEALTDRTLGLVRTAAVAGTAVPSVLAHAAHLDAADFEAAVDEAAKCRFLLRNPAADALTFQHDLVRDAVYDSIERPERRRLHAAVAAALAGRGADAADVASHLIAAGADAGADAEVAQWAEAAGARAIDLCAYEAAASWFDEARRRSEPGSAEAVRLRLRAAHARWRSGDRTTAWSEYETAAAEAQAAGDASLLVEAALGFGGGRAGFEVPPTHEAQRRLLTAALAALPPDEHASRALLLSRLSITLAFEGEPERQRDLALQAVDEARRSGDDAALVTALAGWCDAYGAADHVEQRLAKADEMVALASGAGDVELELLGLRFRIVALLEQGQRTAVDRAVQRFAALADELRQPAVSFFVPLFRAALAFADGRVADAERLNAEAAEIADRAQSDNGVILVTSQRFAFALDVGRAAETHDAVRRVVEERPEISGPQAGLALTESYLGKEASARARLKHLLADDLGLFPRDAEWLPALATLAEAAIRARDADTASTLLPHLLPYGDHFAVDGIGASVFGAASYFAGRLATLTGDAATAERLLRSARDASARFRAPLLVAKATWALADALGEAELRRNALAMLDELGLTTAHFWPPPAAVPTPASAPPTVSSGATAAMRVEGDVVALRWRGDEARLRKSKGLGYLRALVVRPGQEVHVLDLAAPHAPVRPDGDLGPVLDDRARAAYRQRITDLRVDIEEAAGRNDIGRAEAAEAELDELLRHLAAATGLGDRDRRPGSAAERARVNVTKSIRQAVDRIEPHLPALAHHLRTTIRTGTFCAYEPDPTDPPAWDLGP